MRLARLRRADLGRRRVGPREERPASDDEGRDEGERDDERYVGNIFVVEVLLDEVRPARAGDLPDVHGGLVRGHHRREGGLGKDPFVGWREAHREYRRRARERKVTREEVGLDVSHRRPRLADEHEAEARRHGRRSGGDAVVKKLGPDESVKT